MSDGPLIWTRDHTMRFLNANPLPQGFRWKHRDYPDGPERPVQPSHKTITAYGKWLRETPYFQGLFELVHATLCHSVDLGDAEWLAEEVMKRRVREEQEKLPL